MNQTINRKRKRSNSNQMKSVRFNPKVIVLETYSSDEYDRSDIFSAPVLYKLNPAIKKQPQLSLTIVPTLIKDDEEDEEVISSAEINTPPLVQKKSIADHYFTQHQHHQKKKNKPSLSVNTSICSDPLFFTSLSTNYKDRQQDTSNDFLVPLSATSTSTTTTTIIQ